MESVSETICDNSEKENPTEVGSFIDLFAGCGGLTLGLLRAGWMASFAVEKDHMAFETFSTNLLDGSFSHRFDWPSWLPKTKHCINDILRNYKQQLVALKGKIDLVVGGPPCQGFSMAGKRMKNDSRNHLLESYVDFVDIVNPNLILVENVIGIQIAFGKQFSTKTDKPIRYSDILEESLRNIGYETTWIALEASDFGVPQRRPRSFLFGVLRDNLDGEWLYQVQKAITHARSLFHSRIDIGEHREINVSEAISDLKTIVTNNGRKERKGQEPAPDRAGYMQISYMGPETPYQKLLHQGMDGKLPNSMSLVKHRIPTMERFQTLLNECEKGTSVSKYLYQKWGIKKRCLTILDPKIPSRTITTIPDDLIHYDEPRVLTVREMARLQSFPDWFEFKGKHTTGGKTRTKECPRYTQVANAVPPFVSEAVGIALEELLTLIRHRVHS